MMETARRGGRKVNLSIQSGMVDVFLAMFYSWSIYQLCIAMGKDLFSPVIPVLTCLIYVLFPLISRSLLTVFIMNALAIVLLPRMLGNPIVERPGSLLFFGPGIIGQLEQFAIMVLQMLLMFGILRVRSKPLIELSLRARGMIALGLTIVSTVIANVLHAVPYY